VKSVLKGRIKGNRKFALGIRAVELAVLAGMVARGEVEGPQAMRDMLALSRSVLRLHRVAFGPIKYKLGQP
jgi:hypothetical protein